MDKHVKDWTKSDFLAYVLIYAANCDFIETDDEKNYILQLVPQDEYNEMHLVFDYDNDYQASQKIIDHIKEKDYSKEELGKILKDIEGIFMSDNEYDSVEKILMIELKKLFQL